MTLCRRDGLANWFSPCIAWGALGARISSLPFRRLNIRFSPRPTYTFALSAVSTVRRRASPDGKSRKEFIALRRTIVLHAFSRSKFPANFITSWKFKTETLFSWKFEVYLVSWLYIQIKRIILENKNPQLFVYERKKLSPKVWSSEKYSWAYFFK